MTRSFEFRHAIARLPADSYHEGLTTEARAPGDIERFLRQHAAYVDALRGAGLEVEVLEPLAAFPDAHFVEDVAVIVPGLSVLTRPGADSRRDEPRYMEPVLRRYGGKLAHIDAPGTLDGGDVLVLGRHCFIGLSARTNGDGAAQLSALLEARGFVCATIPVAAGLHLKSSVTAVSEDRLISTETFAGHEAFRDFHCITVAPAEAYAANLVRVNDRLLIPRGFDRVRERLEALDLGIEIVELEVSEARRMDGGLTCMSLRF